MIKIKVQVEDWDTGELIDLTLPCDVKNHVDTTHDLYIIDFESDLDIGYYDDILKLNEVIDDINAESPSMTVEILDAILKHSGCSDLSSDEFLQKICRSDYMLEEVCNTMKSMYELEEECAKYLATEMMIPFAKNITEDKLLKMSLSPSSVVWKKVWEYYDTMGFEIITAGNKVYAFHWGDAVE